MSELTPQQNDLVESIFGRAIEISPEERVAFLDSTCADSAVRAEVESLLAVRPAADRLLREPITDSRALADALYLQSMRQDETGTLGDEPDRIGPYAIVSKLGEGGMGSVYLAEQTEPLRRRVALKLIKPGMDTQAVLRRFEAELQALAMMNHPNVARALDAGTTTAGRPYFVMEYVEGRRITQFCDQERLDVRGRLELFAAVCRGVQHAHQKGIIHRDLKPSNVLVAGENGTAIPKVIDFGVAKATNQRLTERTLFTETGIMIGTPEYMSPEQADSSEADIDTRSDVYSLGVLLYELLVGALPVDADTLRNEGYAALQRLIRERDPQKPSTRLSNLGPGAREAARNRRTDRTTLWRTLRGDLDWMVMKCLEKDRERRYTTVAELIDDIERYLHHQPVAAGPPSMSYRARKFVRRNRALVIGVLAVFFVLVAGIISTGVYAVRASEQRAAAQVQAEIAKTVNVFLNEMLLSVDPRQRGPETTVRQVLDQAADRVEAEIAEHQAVQRSIRTTIGRAYQALGLYEEAYPHLRHALDLAIEVHGAHHPETAVSMNQLGYLLRHLGRFQEAESLHRRALEIQSERFGERHVQVAESMNHLAQVLYDQGKYDEGRPYYLRSFAIRSELLGESDPAFIASLNNLARTHYTDGNYGKAEALLRETLQLMRDLYGDEHPDTVGQMNNVAFMAMTRGRLGEAERLFRDAVALYRKLYGESHPDIARTLNNLGESIRRQGRYEQAALVHREALAMRRKNQNEHHTDVDTSLNNLGLTLTHLEQYEEAERLHREALAIRRVQLGDNHPRVATSQANLAFTLFKQGRHEPARALFEKALTLRRQTFGDQHPNVANTKMNLARCLVELGDLAEAESLCREALEIQLERLGDNHNETTATRLVLGRVLVQAGRYSEAESVLLSALKSVGSQVDAATPQIRRLWEAFVELYDSWGRPAHGIRYRELLGDEDSPGGDGL